MSTELTRAALRGLLVPDSRFSYQEGWSDALASCSQAGALPGVPEPDQATALVLEATGQQTQTTPIQIRTMQAGHPDGAAGFVWRYEGDDDWRGWDGPQVITAWEYILRSTAAGYWTHPHGLTLRDGTVLVASEVQSQMVTVYARNPATGGWTGVTVYNEGSPVSMGLYPCLLLLPSGRVLLFSWRQLSTKYQIRLYYSDDNGVNWSIGQQSVLPSPINTGTHTPGRIRAGYLDGNILLIAHITDTGATEDQLYQYASIDLGGNFSLVGTLTGVSRGYPEIIPLPGALLVVYLAYRSATAPNILPYMRRLGSAWEALSAVEAAPVDVSGSLEWGDISGGVFTNGDLAGWRDEDGKIYLLGRDHAGGTLAELLLVVSEDEGESWAPVGMDGDSAATGAMLWDAATTAYTLVDFHAVFQGGRAILFHRFVGGPAPDSLCVAYLGGYSTVTLPLENGLTEKAIDQIGWWRTWLPVDEPQNVGTFWTLRTGGAPTRTLGTYGIRVQHPTISDSNYWDAVLTDSLTDGAMALLDLDVQGGTGYLELQITDAINTRYRVRVEVTATTTTAKDILAGTSIASVALGGAVQVLLAIREKDGAGQCSAWVRARNTASDRAWTLVASTTSLTSGTLSVGTTAQILWGTLSGSSSTDVRFMQVCVADSLYTGTQLAQNPGNPTDLLPRAFSAWPLHVDGGLFVRAVDGPTFRGDSWTITPRYTYGVSYLHPEVSASPRRGWRSTDTTEQVLAWRLGTGLSDVHAPLDRLMGVYLGGINFRLAELHGRDSSGTWVKLLDLDAGASMTGLDFIRQGSIVRPDPASGPAGHYFSANLLAGGSFFDGTVVRRVATNTDGHWGGNRAPQVKLASYDAGDATSGTGEFWSSEMVGLVAIPLPDAYNAYKLVIPAQDTAEGYFTVGVFLIGPMVVLGDEYNIGRSLGVSGSWTQTETRGGMRSFRANAPVRRSVEIDWTEGVDTSDITKGTPDPDYLRAGAGGPVVAAESTAPYLVPGLYAFLQGAVTPLVYLAGVSLGTSGPTVCLSNRQRFLYGRIVSESLRSDSVVGDEWGEVGEIFRVSKVRMEEEL